MAPLRIRIVCADSVGPILSAGILQRKDYEPDMMKLIAWGIVSIAVTAGCTAGSMSSGDAEALYMKRFEYYRTGAMSAIYDTMEPVTGASPARSLPAAPETGGAIDLRALAAARDYAGRNNSTAFLVWRGGRLEAEDYFGATTRETPLPSLSLAKPLAAIAIGRALTLGKIKSLDEPAADFITAWRGTPKAKILIRHILQMQSGLEPQDFNLDPASAMNRAYLSAFHGKVLIDEYRLTDEPGTRYAYSNATAELVAIIIERATGRRYAEFLSDEVLKPLGAPGGNIWIDRPNGLAHSGCCIFLPAETWLRFGILVAQDGVWEDRRLLGHDFVQAMIATTPQNPYAAMMGIYVAGAYTPRRGFSGPDQPGPKVLHSEPYLAADLVVFDGNADQVVYIVPSAGLVALRMGSPPPKSPEWDNSAIPNLLLRGIDWQGHPPAPQKGG